MKLLINSALRPSTRLSYVKTWHNFLDFLTNLNYPTKLPIDNHAVGLYITHIWRSNLKPSTIRTYLSAISYFHKIHGQDDPTNSYFVKQVIKGATRQQSPSYKKLKPLSKLILQKVLTVINTIYVTKYQQCLYKALISLSYCACLRAGEAVISTSGAHTLHIDNVKLDSHNSIIFQLKSYKHCISSNTKFIIHSDNTDICPVKHLSNYLALRSECSGPLFIFRDGTPVTRSHYSEFIKNAVNFIGLNPAKYNTHSVRIGRATDLALSGISPEVIKQTGRWSSSAYLNYIRLDQFILPNA